MALQHLDQYYFRWTKWEKKKKTKQSSGKKIFQIIIRSLPIIKPPSKQTARTLKAFPSGTPELQNKFRPVPSTHFFPVCKCDTIRPHMQASLSSTGRTFVRYVDVFPPKPLTQLSILPPIICRLSGQTFGLPGRENPRVWRKAELEGGGGKEGGTIKKLSSSRKTGLQGCPQHGAGVAASPGGAQQPPAPRDRPAVPPPGRGQEAGRGEAGLGAASLRGRGVMQANARSRELASRPKATKKKINLK